MKKLVSTILATVIVLSTFTACGTEVDKVENTTVTKYTTKGKTNELVPDETATGKLVVSDYVYEGIESPYYDIALKMYNELYPNVELVLDLTTYEEMNDISYYDKIAAEVMSGGGPDIFKLAGNQDVYKMMKSGVFADLTPYFENDQAFDVSEYNEAVLYGAQFQGKQYIVPIEYYFESFLSTKEIVDEIGFDVDKCTNYYNTMEEIYRVSKENVLNASLQIAPSFGIPHSIQIYGGLNTFDYINNTVDINNDIIRSNLEIAKATYDLMDLDSQYNQSGNLSSPLVEKESLFESQHYMAIADISSWSAEVCTSKESVFIPRRNAIGGITASSFNLIGVNANSDSVQNAYNFMKLQIHPNFLEKVYHSRIPYFGRIPLNYKAIQISLDRYSEGFTEYGTDNVYSGFGKNENVEKLEKDFFDALREIDELDMHLTPMYILFEELIAPYFDDEITLDKGLQNAQDKLELYISE